MRIREPNGDYFEIKFLLFGRNSTCVLKSLKKFLFNIFSANSNYTTELAERSNLIT